MMRPRPPAESVLSARPAMTFVVLLGTVSLFADMTYEGARSIAGPYLAVLGASGTVVGVVAGLGELLGYTLRLVSGLLTDKTQQYWAISIVGYVVNLMAVPLLALTGHWPTAAALMITERIGKAIRNPARDAMLSHATHSMGRGWGFGLHEAMDQIGAVIGPLIVAAVLYRTQAYRPGFAWLLIPAILALGVLLVARRLYPNPQHLEPKTVVLNAQGFLPTFWLYVIGAGFLGAGFVDFPLIAYHIERHSDFSPLHVPLLYAFAMGVQALAALALGWLYDRAGTIVLIGAALVGSGAAPLAFGSTFAGAVAGMALWGVGMGAMESVLRAGVAGFAPAHRRATAYGVFNSGFGVCWFLGSLAMGVLYDTSLPALIGFSVVAQWAALPLLVVARPAPRQPA